MTVISISSLPSRTNYLRCCLQDLLEMTNCEIYVFIPSVARRKDLDRAARVIEDYPEGQHPRVHIKRNLTDYGPVSKYFSARPTQEWTLVVDDDQRFVQEGLEKLLNMPPKPKTVYGGHGYHTFLIPQLAGCTCVFLPPEAIETLYNEVASGKHPECCSRVDDDFISWTLFNAGFRFEYTAAQRTDITYEEGEPTDSLRLNGREKDVFRCRMTFTEPKLYFAVCTLIVTSFVIMCIILFSVAKIY